MSITDEHVRSVCKIGQGVACCRYLTMGDGFECAKGTHVGVLIDRRVEMDDFNARGDNCSGWNATQQGDPDDPPTDAADALVVSISGGDISGVTGGEGSPTLAVSA